MGENAGGEKYWGNTGVEILGGRILAENGAHQSRTRTLKLVGRGRNRAESTRIQPEW